ncbi:MAG: ABC transporter permease [Anaerolineales bacterium]
MALSAKIKLSSESAAPTWGQRFFTLLRALLRQPAHAFGTGVFVMFLLLALLGPLLAPFGVNEQIVQDARQAPSASHWFGTDRLGRDVFSRVVLGAADIFALAGVGTLLAVTIGASLGLLSGYRGGWFDELLMRFFDSLLALPALLLALLLLGTLGPSRNSVLLVIVVVYIPIVARVVRSVVLSVKTRAYIEAARVQGESSARILFREIFPAVLPALAVEAALRFSYAIFLASSLGFLGVGVQPPSPDWGLMVFEARGTVSQTPWALYFPAAAISLLVISVNLLADGLKRVFQVNLDH